MMKPYFTYLRNFYPKDQALYSVAHWCHPAVYGAMMIGGADQEGAVKTSTTLMYAQAVPGRPQRTIVLRKVMPRYSRMSPESANIFDNLHMLHGIVHDILAYEGWSVEEKRAERYPASEGEMSRIRWR